MRRAPVIAAGLVLLACAAEPRGPSISRAWPAMGTTISAALWSASADTAALARIADAMRDTLQRLDSLLRSDPHGRTVDRFRRAALDSTRIAVRRHTGVELDLFLMANGYALDRATATLAGAVDSALLDLGGLFLWVAARGLTDRVVGIANPDNALETLAGVQLQRGALRTLPPPPSERLYETEEERARRPAPAPGAANGDRACPHGVGGGRVGVGVFRDGM
ncbi:MAG: FAD:protein FMN transferase [Gemmatimonadales bacterium]